MDPAAGFGDFIFNGSKTAIINANACRAGIKVRMYRNGQLKAIAASP